MLIYLHGLNSSALSSKAMQLVDYCGKHSIPCVAPTLPHQPSEAIKKISNLIEKAESQVTLVGSSMGGFYATWLGEQFLHLRAVLINPAVRLADKLAPYVGQEQINYHSDERYIFSHTHLEELHNITPEKMTHPERYLLMAQTGDEILDYQEAVDFYQGAKQIIEEGGDHSFVNFNNHLSSIIEFHQA